MTLSVIMSAYVGDAVSMSATNPAASVSKIVAMSAAGLANTLNES